METISTVDNALDSLQRFAGEVERGPGLLDLKGALWWGWHAVTLLAHHRLRPARESFDHWFWDYLAVGEPELDVVRDASWEERQRLSLLELLDVLSAEELPLLKPEFYQGWQDRTSRCRTLRRRATEVLSSSISADQREQLLLLLAAYHRLLRLPASVETEPGRIRAALPALLDLAESLVDRSHDHAAGLLEAIATARGALG